jgi:hypothetical protein
VRVERWPTETGSGETEVVCERVASVRLRYLGGSEEEDRWNADSETNPELKVYTGEDNSVPSRELPKAVEITLLLAPPADAPEGAKPRVYRTTVALEANGVTPFQPEVVPPPQPASRGRGGNGAGEGGTPGG